MGKTLTCCTQFWRWLFVVLNIIFLIIGLGLVAVGIYLLAVDQSFSFITTTIYASPAALLIIAGVITGVITVVGIIGSIGMWYIPLIIYISIMSIVVLLQIVAAILGAVFRDNLTELAEDRVESAIEDYSVNGSDSDVNRFIDGLQEQLNCCGFIQVCDWADVQFVNQSDLPFPESCECEEGSSDCVAVDLRCDVAMSPLNGSQFVYNTSCEDQFNEIVTGNLALVIGVSLAFGIFEILGVAVAIALCVCACMKKGKNKEAYTFDDYVY